MTTQMVGSLPVSDAQIGMAVVTNVYGNKEVYQVSGAFFNADTKRQVLKCNGQCNGVTVTSYFFRKKM